MRNFAAIAVMLCLGACGDPMATLPRLSDADIPEDTTQMGVIPDPPTQTDEPDGFLARLFSGSPEHANPKTAGDTDQNVTVAVAEGHTAPRPETYGVNAELPETPKPRGSFLATLFSAPDDEASITQGDRDLGTLPYGKVARVCDMPRRSLGKAVARYPKRRHRYVLHDSDPGNTAPHSFYVTGFDDGCARQFTASVAIFGSVGMHEQLRYGLPAEVQPYSDTDKAYEKVKSRICGVPRKKPCGRKLNRLENDTVFLSIYKNFGGNQKWLNLLLHSGRVLAHDIKG